MTVMLVPLNRPRTQFTIQTSGNRGYVAPYNSTESNATLCLVTVLVLKQK